MKYLKEWLGGTILMPHKYLISLCIEKYALPVL